MVEKNLQVSSALKTLIGRELITDQYAAVFELVKNAYDANANEVSITIDKSGRDGTSIKIHDNGNGMSPSDIEKKWMIIAYSEKKNTPHSIDERIFSGEKGIGRFSCDRLGEKLDMLTSSENFPKKETQVKVDWNLYDTDQDRKIEDIKFDLITRASTENWHGTKITIKNVRDGWEEKEIKKLDTVLTRLINPHYLAEKEKFNINLGVIDKQGKEDTWLVENFIFEKLDIKTTSITVEINKTGETITTNLTDRGQRIYSLVEENKDFKNLKSIKSVLYYLNKSAKHNFTRAMSIAPVSYGSVFIYKNGFRIYPYGDVGDDSFLIDRRKQQGYARFLGTRDIIGRIQILGNQPNLSEVTSRTGGLRDTPAKNELFSFFHTNIIGRLNKYVLDAINWGDSVLPDNLEAKKNIMKILANVTKKNLISFDYDNNYFDNKSIGSSEEDAKKLLVNIKKSAEFSKDKKTQKTVRELQKQISQLSKFKGMAKDNLDKQSEIDMKNVQNMFLERHLEKDKREYLHMIHAMREDFDLIKKSVDNILRKEKIDYKSVIEKLSLIRKSIVRCDNISKFVLDAKFAMHNRKIRLDLFEFLKLYKEDREKEWRVKLNLKIEKNRNATTIVMCKPIDIFEMMTNILSNAQKAKAKFVTVYFKESKDKNMVNIEIKDDGMGISSNINPVSQIFDLGFTTTNGFGIGLNHVKDMIEKDMEGSISVKKKSSPTTFSIHIPSVK